MPPCNITLYQWCVYWLLSSSKDLREGLKINKGPLLGYIGSLHLWLPVGLQSIQFRPPYKVRIVRRFLTLCSWYWYICIQGWGQFHFFNSIPIPLFSIPIPIPIPLLTISFNSNSNSNSGDFNSNSNSNSRDFKSRQYQFQKSPVDVFLEIDYNYTNNVHVYKIIVINTISLISLVEWL